MRRPFRVLLILMRLFSMLTTISYRTDKLDERGGVSVNKTFTLLIFAGFLLVQPLSCFAFETQSSQNDDLALEMFQMTQSLDELIGLLKTQQAKNDDFQKLQSSISYLSFRSRSIEMQQYELRFKKERRDSLERNIVRIKEELDNWDNDKKELQSNNPVAASSNMRSPEVRLKMFQESLDNLDSEIIKLENEIQAAQDELASFETYVQKRLKLIN